MADDLENLKNDSSSSWGGSRDGAGRPKGSMNPETIERMKVKAEFIKRVNNNAHKLFNAQFNLAVGEQYLMWKHKVGSGNKERVVVETITDEEVIKAYLDDTLDINDGEFYFISTKPANGMAIDSLLNRSFGKAEEKIDHTTNGKDLPTPILGGLTKNVQIDDGDKEASQA